MNIQKETIFRHVGPSSYRKDMERIAMCSFVSLLVKSSVVKEVGLPFEEYFVWTDDCEYTGRISSCYPCYMIPASHVIHAMKKNMRVNFAADSSERLKRYRNIYRNDVHCYRRYGLKGWIYIFLKDVNTVMNILFRCRNGRKERIKVLLQGFKDGLSFSPVCETWDGKILPDVRMVAER